MARVTVEDCIDKVSNRFDLVVMSAHRARQLGAGLPPLVERDDDKNTVVSLREIAEEKVSPEEMLNGVTQSYRSHVVLDAEEDDFDHLLEPETATKSVEIGSLEDLADGPEEETPADGSSSVIIGESE